VLWLAVPDEPGTKSVRGMVERNVIGLLSNGLHPVDRPSSGWLGAFSPRARIRASGLWNLNHVEEEYDPTVLDSIRAAMAALRMTI
jgi:hypothetical protein